MITTRVVVAFCLHISIQKLIIAALVTNVAFLTGEKDCAGKIMITPKF